MAIRHRPRPCPWRVARVATKAKTAASNGTTSPNSVQIACHLARPLPLRTISLTIHRHGRPLPHHLHPRLPCVRFFGRWSDACSLRREGQEALGTAVDRTNQQRNATKRNETKQADEVPGRLARPRPRLPRPALFCAHRHRNRRNRRHRECRRRRRIPRRAPRRLREAQQARARAGSLGERGAARLGGLRR